MRLIYSIGIYFYGLIINLAAYFNPRAKNWIAGRRNLHNHLLLIEKDSSPKVWFHVASLGEFEQARPLMESWRIKFPNDKIILSFFSPSGYNVRKNYEGADQVLYIPLDTRKNARRWLEAIKPHTIFFVKYEFWYNFMYEIKHKEIPFYLVSGIFRKDQIFFKSYGSWFRKQLSYFTHIFVQNKESLDLLSICNCTQATLAGDTRFDRVYQIISNAPKLDWVEEFKNDTLLIVGGSTWDPEESLLADIFSDHPPEGVKLILAPHETNELHIRSIEEKFKGQAIRYSKINAIDNLKDYRVLIVDNVGMLTSIYSYADLALVGGAFKTGLHNILEPAAYGIPVFHGPIYSKFDEAIRLLSVGGSFSSNTPDELKQLLLEFILDETKRLNAGKASAQFVKDNTGATDIILKIF